MPRSARIAGRAGKVVDLISLGTALTDSTRGWSAEYLGSAAGGWAGRSAIAWGAAVAAWSSTGPWAAAIVVTASVVGDLGGGQIGGGIGSMFDPAFGSAVALFFVAGLWTNFIKINGRVYGAFTQGRPDRPPALAPIEDTDEDD